MGYYDEDLGNCLDSKVLRAYNKQVKSKKAEEKKDDEKKEREKKEREKERNDKDDNDSSSSNDDDDDNDSSGGGGGGDAISFNFMSTFPAPTNSQPAFPTDRLTNIASRLQQQFAAEKQAAVFAV